MADIKDPLASSGAFATEVPGTVGGDYSADIQNIVDEIEDVLLRVESNALNAEAVATAKASAASTSATSSATSASASSSSASASSTSATNAASSASAAATSASNAATSETNAGTSETNAAASAAAALVSENNAAASESAAATSETNAGTSETNAANSATAAANSATASAASATTATNAKTAAEAARDTALTALENFDDRYFGAFVDAAAVATYATAEGFTLDAGDLFFDTTVNVMKVYDGSQWLAVSVTGGGALTDINDVTITSPSTGEVLKYNGTVWVNDTIVTDLVGDTTPQLGGTLDANSNIIDMGVNTITDTKVGNWDTAYGWGDHSTVGYELTANLGTAAYTASTAYATAAQGALADSALQSFTETNDLTAAVTWANIPDANVPQSAVTQHQAALSITESQISDLQSYLTSYTETNDLTSAVTWANVPDANITQSSVTQHQAALSITESQISDLQTYLTGNQTITLSGDVSGSGTTSITVTIAAIDGGNAAS